MGWFDFTSLSQRELRLPAVLLLLMLMLMLMLFVNSQTSANSDRQINTPKSYKKYKEMVARLDYCEERWITTEGVRSLMSLHGDVHRVWWSSDLTWNQERFSPFKLSRDNYLSQYFPKLTSSATGFLGMTGRLCRFSLSKSAARGKYGAWFYWSGVSNPDYPIALHDYTYWPASRNGDISGLINFLAEYYQGQILIKGNVSERGSLGNGALITFPEKIGFVYVRLLEFNSAGRDKKYDNITIDIFLPSDQFSPALLRLDQTQLTTLNKELLAMNGNKKVEHPYYARELEKKRLERLRVGGTKTMEPWPADFSGFLLSELSKLFIQDRTLMDVKIAESNRRQKAENDAWQKQAEGNSYREALSGALAEVQQEHADLYGSMNQQTQQAVGNVISMSGGGGGSYHPASSSQAIRAQREQEQKEAADEARRARYGTKQAELKRCQSIGGRWGGGSPDFLLDGFCDETVIKPASTKTKESKASTDVIDCDTASGNQVKRYSKVKQQEVCVTLGPIQPEATAYCWDVNFKDGYLHVYTEEKNRRYLCDGPIQKLSVSVPTVREALNMTGCKLDTVRDSAQLDRIHGDYWFHCGYGLTENERDVWMLRKKTNARPGALEYRCRENAPSPCRVLNDSAREGLLD